MKKSRGFINSLDKNEIMVFGSNRRGIHGAGAARTAAELFGAVHGKGEGLYGNSYALPTKDTPWITLSLPEIKKHVDKFIECAKANPDKIFYLTRVGCGLAGLNDADIIPMFMKSPENVLFPHEWIEIKRRTW